MLSIQRTLLSKVIPGLKQWAAPASYKIKTGGANRTEFRSLSVTFQRTLAYRTHNHRSPRFTKEMQQQKLQKQMAADARVLDDKSDLPQTGPRSGSQKSRAVESESLRLPPEFVLDVKKAEEESGAHLEAIKKHFTDSLGLEFDDWQVVQTALTHYSYLGARVHNDALSRLGEKALRFVLVSEMQALNPKLSKQAWYLATNLRFLTRFEFLATYIESTLQLSPLTRFRPPSETKARLRTIVGKEATNLQHSVIAKSVLALIGAVYKVKGEEVTRAMVRTLFIDPYKNETGEFVAPVLQPLQISQTGRL